MSGKFSLKYVTLIIDLYLQFLERHCLISTKI